MKRYARYAAGRGLRAASLSVLLLVGVHVTSAEAQLVRYPAGSPGRELAGCYVEYGLGKGGKYPCSITCQLPGKGVPPLSREQACSALGPNGKAEVDSGRGRCTIRTGSTQPIVPVLRNVYPKGHPKCKEMADDPHLETFDGVGYDLQAAGEFVGLASEDDDLEIQYRLEPPGARRNVSMVTAVAARVGERRVVFTPDPEDPVRVNGVPFEVEDARWLSEEGSHLIVHEGSRHTVVWPDGSNLHVEDRGRHLNVYFLASDERVGHLTGLFGDGDGDPANDFRVRDGSLLSSPPESELLYAVFAESWRVDPEASLFDYAPGESTETFTDRSVPAEPATLANLDPADRERAETVCREAGVVAPDLLHDCIVDYGYTGDQSFVASAASRQPPVEFLALRDGSDDLAPGEGVLFEEDFTGVELGAFPSGMERIRGEWQVVEIGGSRLLAYTGNRNGAVRIDLPESLPESFRIELTAHLPQWPQNRLVVLTGEPEERNFHGRPHWAHHYVWLDERRSGILHHDRREERVAAPLLAEGLVRVRLEVEGSRATLHIGGEPLVHAEDADFPRTDVVWIQSANNAYEPLYVADIRVVAGPLE